MADTKTMLPSSGSAPLLTAITSPSKAPAAVRNMKETTDTDGSATTTTTDNGLNKASARKLRGNSNSFKYSNSFSPARKIATTTSSRKSSSSPRLQRASSMHFNFETVRPPHGSPQTAVRRHLSSAARTSTASSLHPSLVALLTKDAGTTRLATGNHTSGDDEDDDKPVVFRRQYDRLDWKRLAAVDVEQMYRTKNYDSLSDNLLQLTFCDVESEISNGDPRLLQLFKLTQLGLEFLLFNYDRASKALERARKDRQNVEIKSIQQRCEAESHLKQANDTITSLRDELKKRRKTIAAQQEILNALSTSGHMNKYYSCAYCGKSFIDGVFLEKHINARHPELAEHFYATLHPDSTGAVPSASAVYAASQSVPYADRNSTQLNPASNQSGASVAQPALSSNVGTSSDAESKAQSNRGFSSHNKNLADPRNSNNHSVGVIPVTKTASQVAMHDMLRELRELKSKIASAENEHQQERKDYQAQLEQLSERESNLRQIVETDMLTNQQQNAGKHHVNAPNEQKFTDDISTMPLSPQPQQQKRQQNSSFPSLPIAGTVIMQPLDILPSTKQQNQEQEQETANFSTEKELELAEQIDQLKHLIDVQAQQQQSDAASQAQAVEQANQARYTKIVESCAKHSSVDDLRRFLHTELHKMNEQFEQRLERARTEYTHENADRTRDLLDELEHSKQRLFEATRAVADAVIAHENNSNDDSKSSERQQTDKAVKSKKENLTASNTHLNDSARPNAKSVSPNARNESSYSVINSLDVQTKYKSIVAVSPAVAPPDIVARNNAHSSSAVNATAGSLSIAPANSSSLSNEANSQVTADSITKFAEQQPTVTSSTQQLAALINLLNSKSNVAAAAHTPSQAASGKVLELPDDTAASTTPASNNYADVSTFSRHSSNTPVHSSPSARSMLKAARGQMLERMLTTPTVMSARGSVRTKPNDAVRDQFSDSVADVNDNARVFAGVSNNTNNERSNNSPAIDLSGLRPDEIQLLQQVLLTNDDGDSDTDQRQIGEAMFAAEVRQANSSDKTTVQDGGADRKRKRVNDENSTPARTAAEQPVQLAKRSSLTQAAEIIAASLAGSQQQQALLAPGERELLVKLLQKSSSSSEQLNAAANHRNVASSSPQLIDRAATRSQQKAAVTDSTDDVGDLPLISDAVKSLTKIADRVLLNDADRKFVVQQLLQYDAEADDMMSESVDVSAAKLSPAELRRRSVAAATTHADRVIKAEEEIERKVRERLLLQSQKSAYDIASSTVRVASNSAVAIASDARVVNQWSAHASPRVSRALLQDAAFLAQFRQQAERDFARKLADVGITNASLVADAEEPTSSGGGLTEEQMQNALSAAAEQREALANKNRKFSNYRRLHEQSLSNLNAAIEAAQAEQQPDKNEKFENEDETRLDLAAAESVEFSNTENFADVAEEDQITRADEQNFLSRGVESADSLITTTKVENEQLPLTSSDSNFIRTAAEHNTQQMWQTNRELDAVRNSFELLNPQKRVSFSSRVSRFTPDADLSVADAAASASSFLTHVNLHQQNPSVTVNNASNGGVETSTSFDDSAVLSAENNFGNKRIITASISASDIDKLSADDSFISMLDPVVDKCIQVPSTRDFATSDSNIAVPIPAVSSFWFNSEPETRQMVSASTIGSGSLDEQSGYVEQFDDAEQVNSAVFYPQPVNAADSPRNSVGSRGIGLVPLANNADTAQFRSSTMLLQQFPSKHRDISTSSRTHVFKKSTGTYGPPSRFNSRPALSAVRQQQPAPAVQKTLQPAAEDEDDDSAVDVDEAARILLGQPLTGSANGNAGGSDESSDDDVPDPDLLTLPVLDRNGKKKTTTQNTISSILPQTVSAAESGIVFSLSERSSFRPPTGITSTATDVQLSSPAPSLDMEELTSTLTAMPESMRKEERAINSKVKAIVMNNASSHLVAAPKPHAAGAVIAPISNTQQRSTELKLSSKDLELIASLRDASSSPASENRNAAILQRKQPSSNFHLSGTTTANDVANSKPFVKRGYVRAGDNGVFNTTQSIDTIVSNYYSNAAEQQKKKRDSKIQDDNVSEEDSPPTHEKVIIVGKSNNGTPVARDVQNSSRNETVNAQRLRQNFDDVDAQQLRQVLPSTAEPTPVPAKRRTRPSVDLTPRLQSSNISLDDIEKEMQALNALPSSSRKTQQNAQQQQQPVKVTRPNTIATSTRPRAAAVDDSDDD